MAKQKTKSKPAETPRPPTPMEVIGMRVQKIINSPAAQKAQAAVIYKTPEENQEAWESLLEAISETEGVHLTFQDNDGVRIFWDNPDED